MFGIMRRTLLLCATSVQLFCPLILVELHNAMRPADDDEVQCGEAVYVFDEVRRRDEIVTHTFLIENTSYKTATIDSIDTSCGCTVTTVSSGTTIPGHGSLEVPVEVALDKVGVVQGDVILKFAGTHEPIVLSVKAKVHEDCPSSVDFGKVKRGDGSYILFRLNRFPEQPELKILAIKGGDAYFAVEHAASSVADAVDVTVRLNPDIGYGAFRVPLEMFTNDAEVPLKTVNVTGYVLRPLEASEKSIYLGSIGADVTSRKSIELFGPYEEKLEITRVENSREEIFSWQVDEASRRSPNEIPILIQPTGTIPEGTPSGIVKGVLIFHARVGVNDHRARLEVYGLLP
jgi:hypothetical protein